MLIEAAYRAYSGQLLQAMIRFSRDEEAARDAVAQAFSKAWASRSRLEAMPEAAMRAWIYAAARNGLIDAKRRESRSVPMAEPPEEADPLSDPTDRMLIQSMLERLPTVGFRRSLRPWCGSGTTRDSTPLKSAGFWEFLPLPSAHGFGPPWDGCGPCSATPTEPSSHPQKQKGRYHL